MFDNIIIRDFDFKSDLEKYVEFEEKVLKGNFWTEEYRNFKLNEQEHLIVVTNSTCKTFEIVGVLLYEITKENFVYIKRIEILEEMRGKNIGKSLLYYLEDKLKSLNFEYFYLEVSKNNKNTIEFCLNYGFKKIGVDGDAVRLRYFVKNRLKKAV